MILYLRSGYRKGSLSVASVDLKTQEQKDTLPVPLPSQTQDGMVRQEQYNHNRHSHLKGKELEASSNN